MKNTSIYRDSKEYQSIIDEMFMHFVKSENFAGQSEEQRIDFVDKVQELKSLLNEDVPLNHLDFEKEYLHN